MITLGDAQRLQSLSGMPLLDAAADLVGMPRPSELAKPITTARPEVLTERAAEWQAVADKVRAQRESLQQHVDRTMKNWSGDAAASFGAYSSQLMSSLDAQETALNDVPPVLAGMQDCAVEAKRNLEDFINQIVIALIGAIGALIGAYFAASAGLAALTLAALWPAIAAILATLIIALLIAFYFYLLNRERIRQDCLEKRKDEMDERGERGGRETSIRAVDPPPDPAITAPGFSSIDPPSEFRPSGDAR